jgi:hypothetical protein
LWGELSYRESSKESRDRDKRIISVIGRELSILWWSYALRVVGIPPFCIFLFVIKNTLSFPDSDPFHYIFSVILWFVLQHNFSYNGLIFEMLRRSIYWLFSPRSQICSIYFL